MSDDLAPVYDVYEKEEAPKAQPQSTAPVVPPSLNNSSAGLPTGPLPNDIPALNPNALTPGQLNIPPIPSTQELQKKTEEKQKEMGPAVAANPLSQINLRQYLHDMIDNDMVLGGIGGAGLAYGASKLFNKQAPKKVEERDISKLERREPSFQGYGDELITPAAEREMKDPVIRDGIRESQLKSFINSDKLPTNKDELDLIAKSFQQTHGMTNNAPVNLGQGMNTSAGEPSDFTIPTTQNIGTKINQPGPAVQGNVEVPADSTPVHTQEEQNLESVAQTPAEATKTAEVAHKDVQEAFVPSESPVTNAEPANVEPVAEVKGGVNPEDRIPNYMTGKKDKEGRIIEYKNKQGKDVIGKGGWNWYQGQMGPEAEENWLHQFGRTNQSYKDVLQAIKEGRLKGPEVDTEGKGGKFTREPTVPSYIKGSTNVKMMGALTGLGVGGLAAYQALKHGQETGDYSNLGQLGMDLALMPKGASAIPYMFATHANELNSNEQEELAKRRKMPATISKPVPPPER